MADDWPISLPQRLMREGNSGALGDGLLETQPDIGPPISRPRSSSVVDELAGAMILNAAQLATLKTFYRVTLAQGSLAFNFPDQSASNDPALMKFAKGRGPRWSEVGPDSYKVQINLLVLP